MHKIIMTMVSKVDTFADARERDVLNLAEEMEHDLKNDQSLVVSRMESALRRL